MTTDDLFKSAREIFLRAIEQPLAERDAWLAEACGGDDRLRARVEALLQADERAADEDTTHGAESGSESTTAGSGTPVPPLLELDAGTTIGHYAIVRPLGSGGFGDVYLARRTAPYEQDVALKIIRPGLDTAQVLARFETERQTLALMSHANVAGVLDAGATDEGRPYFVMEYVPGEPITDYCDREQLGTAERLDLFIQACNAVQHAHHKGVIHRDLKPSNILVTAREGTPIIKVIDFGIAKATEQAPVDQITLTKAGQPLGTPAYMSPEQAAGEVDIDTRSDIYSLGALLYRLLVGVLPFDPKEMKAAGLLGVQRMIQEVEPPRPSVRLSSMEDSDDSRLVREIRGDLDWVVMRCLEKDRARRYESPSALVEDLRRHLNHEPVQAGPPSTSYQIRKFIRRNRGPAIGVAAAVALLATGTVTTAWGWRTAVERGREVELRARTAQTTTEFVQEILWGINPDIAGDMDKKLVRMLLENAARRIGAELVNEPEVEASIRHTIARCYISIGELDEAEIHMQRAVELRDEVLGPEHVKTLASLGTLGVIYKDQERLAEAETLLVSTLATSERALGEDHPDTLRCLGNLAAVYARMGRFDDAEALHLKDLRESTRVLGADHRDTIAALHGLGNMNIRRARYDEAEGYLVRALEATRRNDSSTDLIKALNSLGTLYRIKSQYRDAESHFDEARELAEQILGETHPSTLLLMWNLGNLYWRQDRLDDAERVLALTLQHYRDTLGDGHPDTESCSSDLANVHFSRGELDKVEPLYKRALDFTSEYYGTRDRRTLMRMNNLAALYQEQGRLTDAEPLMIETLGLRREIFGDDDPDTLQSVLNLMRLRERQERYADAIEIGEGTLEDHRRVLGPTHSQTLNLIATLGNLHYRHGNRRSAMPLYVELFEGQSVNYGPHSHRALSTLDWLGRISRDAGDHAGSAEWYEELVRRREQAFGHKAAETLSARNSLAHEYYELKRYDEAATMQRAVIADRTEVLGANNVNTIRTMSLLAKTLRNDDRPEEAVRVLADQLSRESTDTTPWALREIIKLLDRLDRSDEALPYRLRLRDLDTERVGRRDASAQDKNKHAWFLLTDEIVELRDPNTALRLAQEANALTEHSNPGHLDTLALAYAMTGDLDSAIDTQRRAINLLPPEAADRRAAFEATLERFESERAGNNQPEP